MLNVPDGEKPYVGVFAAHPELVFQTGNSPAVYEYTALPALTGPKGVNFYPMWLPKTQVRGFITKDCKNPEIAFRLLDFMSSTDASRVIRFGEQGVDWNLPGPNDFYIGGIKPKMVGPNKLWGTPNKKVWQWDFGLRTVKNCNPYEAFNDDGSWHAAWLKTFLGEFTTGNADKSAKERVIGMSFTPQEEDQIREIRRLLMEYRDECQTLFINGQMSLETDWNRYLGELDRIGLKKLLDVYQTAYTRMYK
jgi:putative aldouronate transport system substrate-binding protein